MLMMHVSIVQDDITSPYSVSMWLIFEVKRVGLRVGVGCLLLAHAPAPFLNHRAAKSRSRDYAIHGRWSSNISTEVQLSGQLLQIGSNMHARMLSLTTGRS